jgi:hypothetical protein
MAITRRVWFGKIYVMIYLENIENRAGKITPNEPFYFNIIACMSESRKIFDHIIVK